MNFKKKSTHLKNECVYFLRNYYFKDMNAKKTDLSIKNKCCQNTLIDNSNAGKSQGSQCRYCSRVDFREVYFSSARWSGYCSRFRRRVSGEDVCLSTSPVESPAEGKCANIQLSLFNF